MFGLFKRKKQPSAKDDVLREFYATIAKYRNMPLEEQAEIAVSLQIVWQGFIDEFGSPEGFSAVDNQKQHDYLDRLMNAKQKATDDGERNFATSASLFAIMLCSIIEGDRDLAQKLAIELEPLNRLGFELNQGLSR